MSTSGDPTKVTYSPTQMELIGRLAFSNDKIDSFLPMIFGAWMDVLLLGAVFAVFGIWCIDARPTDKSPHRWFAYYLIIVTCGTTAWFQGMTMVNFARGFGEYRHILSSDWGRWTAPIFVFTYQPAQFFFLHRAYRLCNNALWPVILMTPPIFAQTALAIIIAIKMDTFPNPPIVGKLSRAGLSLETATALILTGIIGVQLYRSRTGWAGTDRLIKVLLISMAESQAPVSIVQIVVLIFTSIWPERTYIFAFLFHPKLTVLCVLFVLLTRLRIQRRQLLSNNHTKSYFTSVTRFDNSGNQGGTAGSGSIGKGSGFSPLRNPDASTTHIGGLGGGNLKSDSTARFDEEHGSITHLNQGSEDASRLEQGHRSTTRLVGSVENLRA